MINEGGREILVIGDDIVSDDPALLFPELVVIV
jgi:hypothetical protein